jgi:hypothetical protein
VIKSVSLSLDPLNTRDFRRREGESPESTVEKGERHAARYLMRYALRDLPDPQDAHFKLWK